MTIQPNVVAHGDHDRLQRRTLQTLALGLVPAGAAGSAAYASAAILGEQISGSETLGGLAAASTAIGTALVTLPLARIMAAQGRRPGLRFGYLVAAGGGVAAMFAALTDWYPMLLLGMIALGTGRASTLASRYAAADLARPDHRARAVSMIIWATTIGSVLGPTIGFGPAERFSEALGLEPMAGPYLAATVLLAASALIIHLRLRPDPLAVSGAIGRSDQDQDRGRFREAARELIASAPGRLAVLSMVSGHVVMVGVMTMTPIHLNEGGHELQLVGLVISLHIVGMYALAPLVGWATDILGARPVIVTGSALLLIGAEFASHSDPAHSQGVFVGMFLIGLGWSACVVAATTMLVNTFEGPERVRVQGLADLAMTASGGFAGVASGLATSSVGYQSMSHHAGLLGLAPVVLMVWMGWRSR